MKYFNAEFPVNTAGRDFIVGDLHGCFTLFNSFLDFIKFDKTKDRMFSVGDLIDRGPNSLDCLRLKYEPWFHSVHANHEGLAKDFLGDQPLGVWWMPNGGNWWYSLSVDEQAEVKDLLSKDTPVLITVNMQNGKKFHVIHAELYEINELDDATLTNNLEEIATQPSSDGDCIIWGRSLFLGMFNRHMGDREVKKFRHTVKLQKLDSMFGPNLSHIYSGHTIVRNPTRVVGQTNLDTGAYNCYRPSRVITDSFGLTFTEPLTDKFWKVTPEGVEETKVLTIC